MAKETQKYFCENFDDAKTNVWPSESFPIYGSLFSPYLKHTISMQISILRQTYDASNL